MRIRGRIILGNNKLGCVGVGSLAPYRTDVVKYGNINLVSSVGGNNKSIHARKLLALLSNSFIFLK
jgi:hypothetical protein